MSYRAIATRPVLMWALVATTTRLPNAMAPLAMVFLGRNASGHYTVGPILAACFVAGEVIGAAFLGTRLNPARLRFNLAVGLAGGAAGFAILVLTPGSLRVVLGAGAFVAGAASAVSPGALRSLLVGVLAEEDVPRAFSAESVLTELIWLAAPGLVVLLALQVSLNAPLILCTLSLVAAVALTPLLHAGRAEQESSAASGRPTLRVVMSGWPVYLTSAAAMALSAVTELVLPALLQYRHIAVGWSGVLLMALAGMSALSAFCFGLRSWPGSARGQSTIFLLATTASVTVAALVAPLGGIAAGLLAAGACQSIVMITRNLSLRQRLPEQAQTAGYSVMYAVQGIGYSVSAIAAGIVLNHATPVAAILGGVALTVGLTVVSSLAERRPSAVPATGAGAESHQYSEEKT